jgi:hypothetical protein
VKDAPPTDVPTLDDLNWAWRWGVRAIEREAFLALPPKKRSLAIARVKALEDLTLRGRRPTSAEQKAAAAALEMSLPRLQALMRAWRQDQSLSVVVPYLSRKPRTRLARPALEIARRVIEKELARYPYIAEPRVSRRIATICERLGYKPPARMTVRSLLEEARRASPPASVAEPIGLLAAPPNSYQSGQNLIVIDQFFEAAISFPNRQMIQASARLLVDGATGFLLGATHHRDLRHLGENAVNTLKRDYHGPGPWHPPQILSIASDMQPGEEARLRARCDALEIGFEFALRRHTRRFSNTVLWPGFEHLRLSPEPVRRTGPAADWPRLSEEELEYLLERAAEAQRIGVTERRSEDNPRLTLNGSEELAAVLKQLFDLQEKEG